MKILVVNGSPKGEQSNSLRLTEKFLEGLLEAEEEQGHPAAEVDRVSVAQEEIAPCRGCFSCWSKTPGKCVIQDGMGQILEKIRQADVLIVSFPLYFFGLPGSLKNLVDRLLPLSLPFMAAEAESGGHPARYDLSGQKRVIISTCGFYTSQGNYTEVLDLMDRLCGKGNYTKILCGQGELFRVPQLAERTNAYLEIVRQAGREFARTGAISAPTQERLDELLFPRQMYEKMADASWGVSQTGKQEDEALVFTRQMAALYNPSSYPGHDIIIEMDYTDANVRCQMILGQEGSTVTTDVSRPYTTLIHTPLSVWKDIGAGKITGPEGMMKHLYSIEGSFQTMLEWDNYFGPSGENARQSDEAQNARGGGFRKQSASAASPQGKTSMLGLFLSPVTLWVAGSISGRWGGFAAIAMCALTLLVFYRNQKTIYDVLTLAGTALLGAALLLGADPGIVIACSYAAFGLMWLVSCLRKIPLTAEYSKNEYGGDNALGNVLFLKTNRILTFLWGIVFLLTVLLRFLLRAPEHFVLMEILTNGLMALMGIFTGWFQHWYPAHVARGKIRS